MRAPTRAIQHTGNRGTTEHASVDAEFLPRRPEIGFSAVASVCGRYAPSTPANVGLPLAVTRSYLRDASGQPEPGLRLVHHTRQDRQQLPSAAERVPVAQTGFRCASANGCAAQN